MCLCLCREGRSYLVGPDYLASRNLLSCLVLRPGLALPEDPAVLSVLESLRDKHILKSDTGTLKTLGEASWPSLQLRSCLDAVCGAVLLGKRPASIQARNTRGFEPYIQAQWGYLAQPCQRENSLCFLVFILSSKQKLGKKPQNKPLRMSLSESQLLGKSKQIKSRNNQKT